MIVDGATAGDGSGAKCDPVAAPLLPLDGPIRGVSVKHRSVAPAKEERRLVGDLEGVHRRADGGRRGQTACRISRVGPL